LQPPFEEKAQNSLQKIETQQTLYEVLAFQHQLPTSGHVTPVKVKQFWYTQERGR